MIKRKIFLFFISCFLFLSMTACTPPWVLRQHPLSFLGGTWETEDKKVQFTVSFDSTRYHFGKIEIDGKYTEMIFEGSTLWMGVDGCSVEDFEKLEPTKEGIKRLYEAETFESYDWEELHGQDHYFTAKVLHSSIYEEGEMITFFRIDKTKDIMVKEFELSEYEDRWIENPTNQTLVFEKDLESIVSAAKNALEQNFENVSDKLEAYYNSRGKCWLIKGTHWLEPFVSVPHILFRTDGTVLAMWNS